MSSNAGDCTKSKPTNGNERWAMLGIERISMKMPAGHIVTPSNHVCGDFKDEFDWTTLPIGYRKRVGAPITQT